MDELKQIADRELPILAQCIIADQEEPTAEKVWNRLKLIDDLLVLQKSRILFMPRRTKAGNLRKDSTMKQILEKRIDKSIGILFVNLFLLFPSH